MSFENWNGFLQEQLSELNKERTEKEPAASEEFKSERTPKSNKNDTLKKSG